MATSAITPGSKGNISCNNCSGAGMAGIEVAGASIAFWICAFLTAFLLVPTLFNQGAGKAGHQPRSTSQNIFVAFRKRPAICMVPFLVSHHILGSDKPTLIAWTAVAIFAFHKSLHGCLQPQTASNPRSASGSREETLKVLQRLAAYLADALVLPILSWVSFRRCFGFEKEYDFWLPAFTAGIGFGHIGLLARYQRLIIFALDSLFNMMTRLYRRVFAEVDPEIPAPVPDGPRS